MASQQGGMTTHQESSSKTPEGHFKLCGRRLALPACFRSGIHHAIMSCLSRTGSTADVRVRPAASIFQALPRSQPRPLPQPLLSSSVPLPPPLLLPPVVHSWMVAGESVDQAATIPSLESVGRVWHFPLLLPPRRRHSTLLLRWQGLLMSHPQPPIPMASTRCSDALCGPAAQTDCQMLSDVPVGIR